MSMSIVVVLGMVGLVVDLGWAYWRKEACKAAAQSAVMAAAKVAKTMTLTCGGSGAPCQADTACPASLTNNSDPIQVACMYAQQNGFTNGGKQTVTIAANTTAPPITGVSPAYWITATASETVPQWFTVVLGQPAVTVAARAGAAIFGGSGGGGCVYVLDPSAHQAWKQSGGNFSTGCGIYVASSASDAAYMNGGNLTLGDGTASSTVKFNIHGQLSKIGGNILPSTNVLQNQPAVSDPMTGLTAPTPGTCLPNPNISGGNSNPIPPGTYCSGITISGGNGIVLQTGVFIFSGNGANFSMVGGNATTAAGGATLYFTSNAGGLSISGGNLNLTAKTGGPTDGIAIWKAGASSATITGSNTTINGIIYMPLTALTYSGGNTPVSQSIIVNTIAMSGGNITQPATSTFFHNGSSGPLKVSFID